MKLLSLLAALSVFAAGPATAAGFFFFMVPGANGERNCVSSTAKVGDRITVPGQGAGLVISIAGPSPRCTDARYPHLAAVDFGRGDVVLPQGQELTECVGPGARVGDKLTIVGVGEVVVKGTRTAASQCTDLKYPLQATVIKPGLVQPPAQQTIQSPATVVPVSAPSPSVQPAPSPEPAKVFSRQLCVFDISKAGDFFFEVGLGKGVITKVLGPWADCKDPTAPYLATVKFQGIDPAALEKPVVTATQSQTSLDAAQKLRELNGLLKDGVITQEDYDAKKRELLKAF